MDKAVLASVGCCGLRQLATHCKAERDVVYQESTVADGPETRLAGLRLT
jgi:hypothetical protein